MFDAVLLPVHVEVLDAAQGGLVCVGVNDLNQLEPGFEIFALLLHDCTWVAYIFGTEVNGFAVARLAIF